MKQIKFPKGFISQSHGTIEANGVRPCSDSFAAYCVKQGYGVDVSPVKPRKIAKTPEKAVKRPTKKD